MRLVAILLLPLAAWAQLQLYVVPPGGAEVQFQGVYDVGPVAVADSVSTRFRIRNVGQTTITVTQLYCAGTAFRMMGAPTTPFGIAPGITLDFSIQFAPLNSGGYSANVQINGTGYVLRGTGLPGLTLRKGGEDVATDSVLDVGSVERGQSTRLNLTLVNTTSDIVSAQSIVLTGPGFSTSLNAPLQVQPGATVPFTVVWTPSASGISNGVFTIDGRTFRLTGASYEPTLPRPYIVVENTSMRSGQQGRVSVRLASVSRAYATGQLRMELRTNGSVRDNDASAMFTNGTRIIPFNVSPGDEIVKLRGDTSIVFQSGTTAGTIVFTLEAAGFTDQGSVVVDPEVVKLDKATAARTASGVDITLSGFDNTRTLNEIAFTFYSNGQPMSGMPIRSQLLADFGQWWTASTLGGMFQLKAAFPITGDASRVTGVDMILTNNTGETKTERLAF